MNTTEWLLLGVLLFSALNCILVFLNGIALDQMDRRQSLNANNLALWLEQVVEELKHIKRDTESSAVNASSTASTLNGIWKKLGGSRDDYYDPNRPVGYDGP